MKETKTEEPTEDKTEEAPKTEEPAEETSEKPTETEASEKPAEVEKVEEVTTEKKSEESIEKGKKSLLRRLWRLLQWTSVYNLEATTEEKVEEDKTGETEEVAKVEVRTLPRVSI